MQLILELNDDTIAFIDSVRGKKSRAGYIRHLITTVKREPKRIGEKDDRTVFCGVSESIQY